jgi:hypothetical protein
LGADRRLAVALLLIKRGDIQFAKVGSSTLILVESLRAFVLARRSSGKTGLGRDQECGAESLLDHA